MLYARAFLFRNCGRFTHISSDFGSQYHTHMFVTSEALYASLTRGATWRHESRFVDLEGDAQKSASAEYFFCDYDVRAKPIWFTPGVFVDEQLQPLPKQRKVVDKNDFNVVDEGHPSTGGGSRPYFVPTYGRIEGVLPNHRLFTCALSPDRRELEQFTTEQTFLLGKKRTMFQLLQHSEISEVSQLEGEATIGEHLPIQVKLDEMLNFREYQVLAATARYLLVRGQLVDARKEFGVSFAVLNTRCVVPDFWVERISVMWGEQ